MDEIVRMMTRDGAVKAMAITGRDLTERARQIHKTLPVATAALGRTLMACSMMGDMLKGEDDSLTLRINGGGPLGTITAVSDSSGNVRGYVQNGQVDLPRKGPAKLDVGAAVGRDGYLTVIRDLGLKEPYVGSVALVSGEIAEDLTSYFVESEQIPTACALGVLVDRDQSVLCAGGYILQLLPGADGAIIDRLEEAVGKLGPVTEVLRGGADARALLERLLDGMEPELLERSPVTYRCYCSRERVERAIVSMGAKEIQDMIDAQGEAEVTCQFCDQVYRFSREELEAFRESCG